MADDVVFQSATLATPEAGTIVAADVIGGVAYQRVKVTFGTDGVATDVSAADPLPVTGTLTVSGTVAATQSGAWTVTANAGTNLNTSLLALESGGNLAAAAASLAVMDDWDESDRAKVNLIVGQAGVQGGSGGVSAITQRVVLATDVGLPAGTNNIGDVDVLTVPADPFGLNADAASATGSISAKLRFIASTGIPITGTVSTNIAQMNGVTVTMGNGASGTGVQRVTLADNSTGNIATIGTSVTPGTGATNLGKAEDAGHTTGDVGVMALGVANTADANISGTTLDYTPISTDLTGAARVTGKVAHDSPDGGNPVKVGGYAVTALPTAVANGDVTNLVADKFGRQVALVSTIRDLVGTQTTTISASTSETTIVTAAGSVFNDLIMLVVSNTSASTNTRIDFRDTTAGSVLFSLQSNGGQPPIGFALATPIPQTSVNTNWTAQCATSTTDVRVYAVFAKNR